MDLAQDTAARGDMSDRCFERLTRLAKTNWGLNLETGKKPLITSRIRKRVQTSGASGFSAYLDLIEKGDAQECQHFISALTTNVTHFFREVHHFEQLEQEILPALPKGPVRIWSAGCSSGQEPYSIAAVARRALGPAADLRILATDVDHAILDRASKGTYPATEASFPTPEYERLVMKDTREDPRVVRPELKSMVTFRPLNLIQQWPISGKFDVIFCRNVAIYFDKPTQHTLWTQFVRHLNPGGVLFIGHSERISEPQNLGLDPAGITAYRKTSH